MVGNLAVGGSGKSPITEYIIRLLKPHYNIATLSRGYGRTTKGYLEVDTRSLAKEVGDEPLQFKRKFPNVTVAVCEKRVFGVAKLEKEHDLILLDDAYQHRALKPGLSMLLFDYHTLFGPSCLLPSGPQRESFVERKRADVLIVTKTPEVFSPMERRKIGQHLNPFSHQIVVFSYIKYGGLIPLFEQVNTSIINRETQVLLITGIAKPQPMYDYIERYTSKIKQLKYADHYAYNLKDIEKIKSDFHAIAANQKIIITTEKDAMRLKDPNFASILSELPIFILPIEACIHSSDQIIFDNHILNYVRKSTKNSSIHTKKS